jgi:hypothetical protein
LHAAAIAWLKLIRCYDAYQLYVEDQTGLIEKGKKAGSDTSVRQQSFKSEDALPVILHADHRPPFGLRLAHQ